ncbi:MAG: hypothetical protein HY720_16455 [Planctomycetes bacterium]|nr:hypothetical protein [Planctomycetota bacterium]
MVQTIVTRKRFTIEEGGNVGIGTTIPNPTQMLHLTRGNHVALRFAATGVAGGAAPGNAYDLNAAKELLEIVRAQAESIEELRRRMEDRP